MAEWFHLDPIAVLDAPRELWTIRVAALKARVDAWKAHHAKE